MNRKRFLIICLVILGLLAAAAILHGKKIAKSGALSEAVIAITKDGFIPNRVTLQAGAAARWVNESDVDKVSVNSDNYPDNKLYRELNLGQFNKGSSVMHTFLTPGTYTYHNQFNPEQTGTIVVK